MKRGLNTIIYNDSISRDQLFYFLKIACLFKILSRIPDRSKHIPESWCSNSYWLDHSLKSLLVLLGWRKLNPCWVWSTRHALRSGPPGSWDALVLEMNQKHLMQVKNTRKQSAMSVNWTSVSWNRRGYCAALRRTLQRGDGEWRCQKRGKGGDVVHFIWRRYRRYKCNLVKRKWLTLIKITIRMFVIPPVCHPHLSSFDTDTFIWPFVYV